MPEVTFSSSGDKLPCICDLAAGLKEICVTSADEAYKLMMIGKRNLRIAATKLNHNSSRR